MATFGDLQKYVERDGWIEEPNLARGHRRTGDHRRYRKDLPDGTTLRTKVSHSLGDEIGVALFKHVLRDQLRTSEDRFWDVVRGVARMSEPPPPQAQRIPGWLVQRLLLTVGLREDEIRAMTADRVRSEDAPLVRESTLAGKEWHDRCQPR